LYTKAELDGMRTQYATEGFIQMAALTTAEDIAAIRSLIDPLFSGVDPPAEVNDPIKAAPALCTTLAYERCRIIARHLLGTPVGHIFDQAILKAPHRELASAHWHQDEIYNTAPMPQRAVNFWIPLEAATIENGCLWQSPGSHLGGVRPHHAVPGSADGAPLPRSPAQFAMDRVDAARAVPCQVAIGGGTAHHPLSAHYAGPNTTSRPRGAWVLHFGAYGRWRYKLHPRAIAAKLRALSGRQQPV
jgi:ectoine hydroxylase-related dioxygenase (phytanoyl-CoA dioxygenase family)